MDELKMNKRFKFCLLSLLSLSLIGSYFSSLSFVNKIATNIEAEPIKEISYNVSNNKHVTATGEAWGNQCYNDDFKAKIDQYKHIFALISYNETLETEEHETTILENFITEDNDLGNKIKVNGSIPLKDVEDARVYLLVGHLCIVTPVIEFISIQEGCEFLSYSLGACTLFYKGAGWMFNPTEAEVDSYFTSTSFSSIAWNNLDYNGIDTVIGKENHNGIPKNGYVLATTFTSPIGKESYFISANMASPYYPVGTRIKVNSTPLKDIDGAYFISNLGSNNIYLYLPSDSIPVGDYIELKIEAHTKCAGAYINETKLFYYSSSWTNVEPAHVTVNIGNLYINKRVQKLTTIDDVYLTEAIYSSIPDVHPIGWTINNVYYDLSKTPLTINKSTSVTVNINAAISFYTDKKVSIKINSNNEYALRFKNNLGTIDYINLKAMYESVETGTFIVEQKVVENYLYQYPDKSFKDYFVNTDQASNYTDLNKIVNIDYDLTNARYKEGYYSKYYASLSNVSKKKLYSSYIGIGYLKLKIGNSYQYVLTGNNIYDTSYKMYDIATQEYGDLSKEYNEEELEDIKNYIDEVCNLSLSTETGLTVLNEVEGRSYFDEYGAAYADNVQYVSHGAQKGAPGVMVIDGQEFDFENTPGLIFLDETFWLCSDPSNTFKKTFNKGSIYGVGEPETSLWNSKNPYGTKEFLSEVSGALGARGYRIWLDDGFGDVDNQNDVSISKVKAKELEEFMYLLIKEGIKEIYLLAPSVTEYYAPVYYSKNLTTSNYEWVDYLTMRDGNHSSEVYIDSYAVIDPKVDLNGYKRWLKAQYSYIHSIGKLISSFRDKYKIGSDIRFYIEGLNEVEFEGNLHKQGSYDIATSTYTTSYYTSSELAFIISDLSYYATKAINETINIGKYSNTGGYTTPSHVNISSYNWDHIKAMVASGVYYDTFIDDLTNEILNGKGITPIDGDEAIIDTNPNHYFQVLNWHPYVQWLEYENSELHYGTVTSGKAEVHDYASLWTTFNNNMYSRYVSKFTNWTPKVVISEYGIVDWGSHVGGNLATLGVSKELASNVYYSIASTFKNLSFASNATLIGFRLLNMEEVYKQDPTLSDVIIYGEGNIGMLNEDLSLKPIMKKYYNLIRASNDYSILEATAKAYY